MQKFLDLLRWGDGGWLDELASGIAITIGLAVATLPLGIVAGFFVALGRQSSDPLVRLSARLYTTVFRALPELLTLFIVYYGSQYLVSTVVAALFHSEFEISPFIAGMVALGLVFSGYAGEVFLSAFRAIHAEQFESGYALGLRRRQVLRLVILPQLVRLALPGLSNQWLLLLKDTSLVSVITLNDIIRQTQVAVASTKQPFFFFAVACLIYLVISLVSSAGIGRVERWASRGLKQ
ncbi:MAG TPA: ABC transporter permease [Bauldia sp.]|nr:ABC transporter permease [Bauldia sp.]